MSPVTTGLANYKGANLPLALRVAFPVTAVGAAFLGMKGAGIVAMGNAIGLPVVALLFLGTAGVTTVIEAFIRDRNVRDPLTKLLLMYVDFETTRRAKKELLDALRADAMVPERVCPSRRSMDFQFVRVRLDRTSVAPFETQHRMESHAT